jgi:hypothetical protein
MIDLVGYFDLDPFRFDKTRRQMMGVAHLDRNTKITPGWNKAAMIQPRPHCCGLMTARQINPQIARFSILLRRIDSSEAWSAIYQTSHFQHN